MITKLTQLRITTKTEFRQKKSKLFQQIVFWERICTELVVHYWLSKKGVRDSHKK